MRVGSFSRDIFSKKTSMMECSGGSSLEHLSLSMHRFGGGMFRRCRGAPPLSWFGGESGGSGPREVIQ